MIPHELNVHHFLAATREIERDGIPPKRKSDRYDLWINEDGPYPPKYVISIANRIRTGKEWRRFNAVEAVKYFCRFIHHGFEIRRKSSLRTSGRTDAGNASEKTESKALQKRRLGQGRFRESLLRHRKSCYVTRIRDGNFLRASHIKPWNASNDRERLDPNNGLLLTPMYDYLFDSGYISFSDNGRIIVSKLLPPPMRKIFGINSRFTGATFENETKAYLAYHRQKVLRDPLRTNE